MYESIIKRLEEVKGKVDAILDTDTYNEIDDQFALSYMLMNPERINVCAVTAAPFFNPRSASPEDGMEKSYNEILKLVKLCGREDMTERVFRGSADYLKDENTYVDSPAAREIVRLAREHTTENPLYIVGIGVITNVASAILMDRSIVDKIVLVWLAGHSHEWPDTKEFNMMQDVAAARVVFTCGAPLVQLACMGSVSGFTVTEPELKYWFIGKNELADYLAGETLKFMNKYEGGKPWSKVIWDVCAVAYLLNDNDRFMVSTTAPSPIPGYDYKYSDEYTPYPVKYVWYINRDVLMKDLIDKLTQGRKYN